MSSWIYCLPFWLFVKLTAADPLRLWNSKWAQHFEHRSYERPDPYRAYANNPVAQKFSAINYSPQGLRDLAEMQDLVGSGTAEDASLLRPYYSMVEMTANGNKQGIGSYLHVLPDEEEGDKPIYTLGGSFSGGIEPAGVKLGNMGRAAGFGK